MHMNGRVSLVPYLPRNGSCIQIIIWLEAALLSLEKSVVGCSWEDDADGENKVMSF